MITSYENFEKILLLSKTLLVQRTIFGVILLVRTAFESSGTTGRLRIWILEGAMSRYFRIFSKAKLCLRKLVPRVSRLPAPDPGNEVGVVDTVGVFASLEFRK